MSAIESFLLPTMTMSASTRPVPTPAQTRPPEKPSEPKTMSTTIPITSVARSATTMGAVFVIGTPCVSNRTSDLKTSPTLPGRDREHEAGEEREEAVELRDAADVEPREVELPLEEAEDVVAEGETARERERLEVEDGERIADLAEAAVEREAEVDDDAEEHRVEDLADIALHGCFFPCAVGSALPAFEPNRSMPRRRSR